MKRKKCQHCGRMFPPPEGISPGEWKKRKYCGQPCSTVALKKHRHRWATKTVLVETDKPGGAEW